MRGAGSRTIHRGLPTEASGQEWTRPGVAAYDPAYLQTPLHGRSGLNPSAHEALGLFRSIYAAVRQHLQTVERRCGAGGAQVWALAVVARQPGIRVSELASAMAIHPSTVSNLLAKAEKSGFIRRERSARDQRVVNLYVTDAGRAVLDRAPEPVAGLLPDALGRLPEPVLSRLSSDLKTLAEAMSVEVDTAATKPFSEL